MIRTLAIICAGGLAAAGGLSACHLADPSGPGAPRDATLIWRSPVPALGPPALDDDAAYFALRDHRIAAVDRGTGDVRWIGRSGQVGDFVITQFSPVRAADVVVFGDWALYAFDAATGALRWRFGEQDARGPGSGEYPFKTDGTVIYAGSVIGSVFAIDAATGQQRWRVDLMPGGDHQVRIMAVRDGRVFLTLRYNAPWYAGRVYALDAASGSVRWTFELPRDNGLGNGTAYATLTPPGALTAPLLIASFNDGRIVALDALTGETRWALPGPGSHDDFREVAAVGSTVIASSTSPDMIAAYDLQTGTERWRAMSTQGSVALDFGALSTDATSVNVVFTNGVLASYNAATGERRSLRQAPTGFFVGAPVVSHDTLFLGGYDAAYAIRK